MLLSRFPLNFLETQKGMPLSIAKGDAPFHRTSYDYSRADRDVHDRLRDIA